MGHRSTIAGNADAFQRVDQGFVASEQMFDAVSVTGTRL
jgi:hypothetical protein